jgi:hypothetical protein
VGFSMNCDLSMVESSWRLFLRTQNSGWAYSFGRKSKPSDSSFSRAAFRSLTRIVLLEAAVLPPGMCDFKRPVLHLYLKAF